jgi:hypothetical protein
MSNSLSYIRFEFENSTNLINFCSQYNLSLQNNKIDYSASIIPSNFFDDEDEDFLIDAIQSEELPANDWRSEISPWLDYLATEQKYTQVIF